MEANLFLEQFGHLAQSSDGVQKLRNLIIQLAVQGRLVPQNPNDEPASELSKRIEAEKKRLYEAGEIKKPKRIHLLDDEIWLDAPHSWQWIRLNELGYFTGGGTPSKGKPEYWDGDIPWISPKDMKFDFIESSELMITQAGVDGSSAKLIPANSVLIVGRSGILQRLLPVAINRVECTVNQDLKVLIPYLKFMTPYIRVMLKGFEKYILENLVKTGMTVQSLKYEEFAICPFPIPPLSEQQRIVAKVDELMQLCDQLEEEQTQRDHLHEHATKSILFHLTNAPSKSEARQYWHYAEQHFTELFDRASTVEELRAAILQLAVQGRLVPQNPDDEPASELLKRIEAEKRRLIKTGLIKKRKELPPIDVSEFLYELPINWEWVKYEEISEISSGVTKGRKLNGKELIEVPYLRVANVQRWFVDLSEMKTIEIGKDELDKFLLKKNDILQPEGGDWDKVGRAALWNGEIDICIHQNHIFKGRLLSSDTLPSYIVLYLNSESSKLYFQSCSKQTTNLASINQTQLRGTPVAIPPLAEQQRIVAKVDELMKLCDQLEEEATHSRELSGRLFDSIMHHMFEAQA